MYNKTTVYLSNVTKKSIKSTTTFLKKSTKAISTFFKKSIVILLSFLITAVLLSTIINAYYRDIQETIHSGIMTIYDDHPVIGEALYEVNSFILNGQNFDKERKSKRTIYDSFGSVVVVNVFAPDHPETNSMSGRGTGFIIDVDDTSATIVTNHHVVDSYINDPEIWVMSVQVSSEMWMYDAELIGHDVVSDIAVIKITKKDNEEWEAIEFADPEDYAMGTPVVVIGHGMGMSWTATQGHVVYKDRFGFRPYNLMIQIDAVINQGNSGGPVFNNDGKVIGVAQSMLSPGRAVPGWDGIGLAISVSQAKRSIDYILSPQYPAKGYVPYAEFPFALGTFEYEDVKDIAKEDRYFAYINYPTPVDHVKGDPKPTQPRKTMGELAGFLQDDILIEVNGKQVFNSFIIMKETLKALPGDIWTVKVIRNGEEVTIEFAMREVDMQQLYEVVNRNPN